MLLNLYAEDFDNESDSQDEAYDKKFKPISDQSNDVKRPYEYFKE